MANFNLQDYEQVQSRIARFYNDHPGGRINTDLIDFGDEPGNSRWIIKATVFRNVEDLGTTGWAEERDGGAGANRTSALENCETSAIGRALANLGYSGDKRASREEMTKTSVAIPDGWKERIEACDTVEALNDLYKTVTAQGWLNDTVQAAFTARKARVLAEVAK